MSERLSDVEGQIGSVQQLSSVVTAMRGIAAARSREARDHLAGIRAYAAAIAAALQQALALLPETSELRMLVEGKGDHLVIAICAEQGFAGAFNERVLGEAFAIQTRPRLFLVGDRGAMIASETGLTAEWFAPMVTHIAQMDDLAGRMLDALYDRLRDGSVSEVSLVYAMPGTADIDVVHKRLIPFDYGRFPFAGRGERPLSNLPPVQLAESLAEEYIFAEVCEGVVLSFAAENEARTRAMSAAKTNVSKTLDRLTALSRQLRQEEITNEIVELAGGTRISDAGTERM